MKRDSQDPFNIKLTPEDFALSFGTLVEDIPDDCKQLIAETDFRYKAISGDERDKVILDVLKRIESDQQIIGAKERQGTWQRGWEENLEDFIKSGYDLKKLIPKFIRPNKIIRLNRNYIMPANPNFELDYFSVFRSWLFKKYLTEYDIVYEFGCGTGFNLVALAQLYPEKRLYGLDFVLSSVKLINKIGEVYGWKMKGEYFDMLNPNNAFGIENNSAVLTVGAVEQLAGKFEPFLQYLLKQSPAICLHVEPTIELYDENNLLDYLAIKFHKKRGYTENFLARLNELEAENKIKTLKVKRLFFGSLSMEGYNLIVWRPINGSRIEG